MRSLILETSGMLGGIALADGHQLVAQGTLSSSRKHARDLVPLIDERLRELGWTPRSIDRVIVDLGPGSYTGLRVGVMAAKTFAYAAGCALVGVNSMSAVAEQLSHTPVATHLEVLVDAQQGNVYVGRFDRADTDSAWVQSGEVTIETIADWGQKLPQGSLVGGGALSRFKDQLPATAVLSPAELWEPSLAAVLSLGIREFEQGRRENIALVEPLYLRASAAQIKWDARLAGQSDPASSDTTVTH